MIQGELITWGESLEREGKTIARIPATVGCPLMGGIALQSGTDLIWWKTGKVSRIDTSAAVVDMAEMEIFGRRGLMVIHRGMQLRFYQPPEENQDRWPYSEIYSFYTASEQGGLIQHDVDGDGRPDLICGNYWVQAPASFDLHWQLYAINLFHEHPLAASARLAWVKNRLLWLESKRPNARAVWFTPPADPQKQWIPEPLGLQLHYPRAVLVKGDAVWIGENNGVESRVIECSTGKEWPTGKIIYKGTPLHTLIQTPKTIVGIGPDAIIHF